MIEKKLFKSAIEKIMTDAGFAKKSGTFYMDGPDSVVVFSVDKSSYSNRYQLNIGVNLKILSPEIYPKVFKCSIQMDAEPLACSEGDIRLNRALDLDEATETDLSELLILMSEKILPVLLEFRGLENLKRYCRQLFFKRALILWQARDVLEAQSWLGNGGGAT